MDKPETLPSPTAPRYLPASAWWLVLGLVGLDCFSTLAYLPTIAADGAERMAPLAAVGVSVLLLLAALPVYLYVVGRSPHGRGATGLLERHLHGWGGKLLVLFLLGFVATDFVMTRTVSLADASKHLLHNPHVQYGVGWVMQQKDSLEDSLPADYRGAVTEQLFDWWDEQLVVTVALAVVTFALFFLLLRGFTRGFLYAAAVVVALFLLVNGIVIVSGLVYLSRRPEYLTNWWENIFFGVGGQDPVLLTMDLVWLALRYLPALVLGLSGFELTMTAAPLVRGRPDDDPARPRGRIRNARKLLTATAVLMAVFVPASVVTVTFLVPPGEMQEHGAARHRALAHLAHGGALQLPGARFGTDNPVGLTADTDDREEMPAGGQPERREETEPPAPRPAGPTADDVNPLFGPAFGALYDLSAVLILCLAGASVTITLRDLLPEYLTRYGMEMRWAHRVGVLLLLFNLILLVVVVFFRASVSHQQGAYATSVLVLLAGASLATGIDLRTRFQGALVPSLLGNLLLLLCAFWLVIAFFVCWDNPAGAVIALLFIGTVFLTAGLSRWMRSTELRFYGFAFADEESALRWEEIRKLEFQVLVPHAPGEGSLVEKDAAIRARHRLGPDVPIIFVEAQLGDPSDFQQQPMLRIVKEGGMEVIRLSQCASIAHVLAAVALEFREVGRPPEVHFAWSDESPLATNLNFLLWGQGNIPWMVHALIRKAEPDPTRRPRVVIG